MPTPQENACLDGAQTWRASSNFRKGKEKARKKKRKFPVYIRAFFCHLKPKHKWLASGVQTSLLIASFNHSPEPWKKKKNKTRGRFIEDIASAAVT